jgi:uncharacterized protein
MQHTLEPVVPGTYNDGMQRCPTCRGEVKPREENPSFPFCSRRCRAVDLGRWFTGEYRAGSEPAGQDPKQPHDEDPKQH